MWGGTGTVTIITIGFPSLTPETGFSSYLIDAGVRDIVILQDKQIMPSLVPAVPMKFDHYFHSLSPAWGGGTLGNPAVCTRAL